MVGALGAARTLVLGGLVQTAATAALLALGDGRGWLWLLLPATFVGGVGNMLAIVGFMVTATSGLPDTEQGLATGLATMTQQIGITVGTPVMSAVVTAATTGTGIATGLGGDHIHHSAADRSVADSRTELGGRVRGRNRTGSRGGRVVLGVRGVGVIGGSVADGVTHTVRGPSRVRGRRRGGVQPSGRTGVDDG